MTEILYAERSYQVVGCAQRVHQTLGPGFPESVYHRALCRELMKAGVPFESEKPLEVWYDGVLCGEFRVDIFVAGEIVLELKAVDKIVDEHVSQTLSYLKASGVRLAIILNFGAKRLETKRVVL